jgi:PadR family transcriptional regulator PadR
MTEERIATNLRKGVLEYCVLALLSHGEKYGLELADDLTARELIASEGSLYPLLARMRENGLVEPRWDSSGTARPRRYYAITDDGTKQLATFAQVWTSVATQVNALLEGSR